MTALTQVHPTADNTTHQAAPALTRRTALRLAMATAVAVPISGTSPATAARLLDAPIGDADPADAAAAPLDDPVGFADEVRGSLWSDFDDLFDHVAPAEYAHYEGVYAALLEALGTERPPANHPAGQLPDAVTGLYLAAFDRGIRVGAATEHLRLALRGPVKNCRRCHGFGSLGANGRFSAMGGPVSCPDCDATGIVPTPLPTLS